MDTNTHINIYASRLTYMSGKEDGKKRKIAQRLKSGQIVRIIFSYVERENETKIYNLCKLELIFFA